MAVKPKGKSSASITAKAVGQAQDDAFEFEEPPAADQPAAEPEPVAVPAAAATAQIVATAPAVESVPAAAVGASAGQAPAIVQQSTPAPAPEPVAAGPVQPEPGPTAVVHPREPVDLLGDDEEEDDQAEDVVDPQAYEIPARLFNKLKAEAETAAWRRRARSPQTEIVRIALEDAAELMTTLVRHEGQTVVHSPVFGTRVVSAPKTRGATERLQVRMTYGETKALRKWADSLKVDVVALVRCALHNRYPEVKRTRRSSKASAESQAGSETQVEASSSAA